MFNNRYQILGELGRGGMGIVYRAHDMMLGRDVALKVVSESALDTQGRARLLAEAQAAASLNHPNIVIVYDAGESEGQPFIVMELVAGHPLDPTMGDLAHILGYCAQVCDALAAAHEQGIIHRDLKPENVLITPSGTVKLMDFGLARQVSGPRLTTDGAVVGTVNYLAAELLMGAAPTVQSDLYALGVMLYEFATGRQLFEGGDILQQLSQHLYATVIPPSTFNPQIPIALETLILSLLEKSPNNRPSSAAEVGARLRKMISGRPDSDQIALPEGPALMLNRMVRGCLVGREKELAEVSAHWQRAVNGQSGLLIISGEPGIGKTRLARELVARVEFSSGLALLGECYAEGNPPFGPFAQIIPEGLRFLPQAALVQTAVEVHREVLSQVVLAELVQMAPSLSARYPDLPPNPPIDPQAGQQRAFESVMRLLSLLTAEKPLLLVIDDVHWADSSTLALVRYILRRSIRQSLRLLIVLAYRETDLAEERALNEMLSEFSREASTLRIKLSRLNRQQTEHLLAAMFAEEITSEFLEGIFNETEGNPFFIEEVCKSLIDSGQLTRSEGRWQRPSMKEMRVPQNVRTAIESRFNRMPPNVQEVLRLASIFGREFKFEALLALSEQGEDALIEALEYAERAQLIQEVKSERSVDAFHFAFSHALIPTSLQEGISALRRQRMHRKALAALAAIQPEAYDRLAFHAAQGGDEHQAAEYFFKAGKRALESFAAREAVQHLKQANELEATPLRRAEILHLLGLGECSLVAVQDGLEHLEQAAVAYLQIGRPDDAANTLTAQISAIWFSAGNRAACEKAEHWVAQVSGWPDGAGVGNLCHEIGRVFIFGGRISEALPLIERARGIAERLNLFDLELHVAATEAIINQDAQTVVAKLEALASRAEISQYVSDALTRVLNNLAVGYLYLARCEDAFGAQKRQLAISRRLGIRSQELWTMCQVAASLTLLGRLKESEQAFVELETELRNADFPSIEMEYSFYYAVFLFWRDGPQAALPGLAQSFEARLAEGNEQALAISGAQYAEALITLGEVDAAAPFLQRALESSIQLQDMVFRLWVYALKAWGLFVKQPRPPDWETQLAAIQEWGKQLSSQPLPAMVEMILAFYRCQEAALYEDWPQALVHGLRYAEGEKQAGRLIFYGRALQWVARIAQRQDVPQARALLEQAMRLFEQTGATWHAAVARSELAALS